MVFYSTTYHAKVNLRGFEFAQGELLGYGPVYVNKDGIPFAIDTKEMGGNVTKVFGRVNLSTRVYQYNNSGLGVCRMTKEDFLLS